MEFDWVDPEEYLLEQLRKRQIELSLLTFNIKNLDS